MRVKRGQLLRFDACGKVYNCSGLIDNLCAGVLRIYNFYELLRFLQICRMATFLAAKLEEVKPSKSQRCASLITTSVCGDFLALTHGNVLRYSHVSLCELWSIPTSEVIARKTITTICFNAGADAVLVAGPETLLTASYGDPIVSLVCKHFL